MKWIKVEDSLPDDGVDVLVLIQGIFSSNPLCSKNSVRVFQGYFNRRHGWSIPYSPDDRYPIIAWMPLPEPPKQGE